LNCAQAVLETHVVWQLDLRSSSALVVAGSLGTLGAQDGGAVNAASATTGAGLLWSPIGLALDALHQRLFIAEATTHLRVLDLASSTLSTVGAYIDNVPFVTDQLPAGGLAVDIGAASLYMSLAGSNKVRTPSAL
jgi:hypothetical protein